MNDCREIFNRIIVFFIIYQIHGIFTRDNLFIF